MNRAADKTDKSPAPHGTYIPTHRINFLHEVVRNLIRLSSQDACFLKEEYGGVLHPKRNEVPMEHLRYEWGQYLGLRGLFDPLEPGCASCGPLAAHCLFYVARGLFYFFKWLKKSTEE